MDERTGPNTVLVRYWSGLRDLGPKIFQSGPVCGPEFRSEINSEFFKNHGPGLVTVQNLGLRSGPIFFRNKS